MYVDYQITNKEKGGVEFSIHQLSHIEIKIMHTALIHFLDTAEIDNVDAKQKLIEMQSILAKELLGKHLWNNNYMQEEETKQL